MCKVALRNSVRRRDVAPCELGSHGYSQWRKAEVAFLSGELAATLELPVAARLSYEDTGCRITLTRPRSALPLLQLEKAVGRRCNTGPKSERRTPDARTKVIGEGRLVAAKERNLEEKQR